MAEAQVEGCDPGHGPGRRLHDQITALAVQQREERRHVRQPAARSSEHTHTTFQHAIPFAGDSPKTGSPGLKRDSRPSGV